MHTGQSGRADFLSAVITVLCAGVGALLFFTSYAPAARERAWLHDVETKRERLRDELSRRLSGLRTQEAALTWDPQTILLAIDETELTPAELLGESVAGMPPIPAWKPAAR